MSRGSKPGEFVHTLGDAHLYLNHLEQANEQLAREPLPLPRLVIKRDVKEIDGFRFEDFEIVGYQLASAYRGAGRGLTWHELRSGFPRRTFRRRSTRQP